MNIKVSKILDAPSKNRLDEFENSNRVKLTNKFISFINNYNGAIVEGFRINVNHQERLIERFLCILDDYQSHDRGEYDISVVITQLEGRMTANEDLVGAEIVPFAVVFGGDFLCLDYRSSKESPNIVLWDHEESDDFCPVTYPVSSENDFFNLFKLKVR